MILDDVSGAVWRMIRGDSLLVLRDLEASSVDAVITDPPYSSGGAFRGDRARPSSEKYADGGANAYHEIDGDTRDQRSHALWMSLWLAECLRVARTGAAIAVFSDWRQLPVTMDAIQCGGWVVRGVACWAKPPGAYRMHAGRPGQACEFVVWGSKGGMPIEAGVPALPGWWVERTDPATREHMTEKPLGVMRDLARLCTPDGVILDPFAGSATTGEAAIHEGRRFVGVETSPAYYEIATRRLRNCEAGLPRRASTTDVGPLFAVSP